MLDYVPHRRTVDWRISAMYVRTVVPEGWGKFFDQTMPSDIDHAGSFSAYSREILTANLQCLTRNLLNFSFYPEGLLIAHQLNLVDS
jgi:hypothetical protein